MKLIPIAAVNHLQAQCYKLVEEITIKANVPTKVGDLVIVPGQDMTLKTGYQISPGSTFDIKKFAELLEDAIISKLEREGFINPDHPFKEELP